MMDALNAKRILVVDGDDLIASDIKSAVEQHGGDAIRPPLRLTKRFHNPGFTHQLAEMVRVKG
jgi:hypothetical protein